MIQAKDIEHVLFHEIDNANQVILYLEDDQWVAFESSAYYLALQKPDVVLSQEIIREGYDVVLIKACFPKNDFVLPLAEDLVLKTVSDGKLQFSMKERFKGFSEWKRKQLERLK